MHASSLTCTLVLSVLSAASANPLRLIARHECGVNYNQCSPKGAVSTTTPPVGSSLSPLFGDLLVSVRGIKLTPRDAPIAADVLESRGSSNSMCCAEGMSCLLLHQFNVPFCYDKFTTNYFLPDGSYGTIANGRYSSTDGSTANLISGDYTLKNGTSGNVYNGNEDARPNTSTMSLPAQWTASGVGSAIPASVLGVKVTYTTTIAGTTVMSTVIPAQTVVASVVSGSTISPATTKPASTISGTVVAAKTEVVTTIAPPTGSAKAQTASANHINPGASLLAVVMGSGLVLLTLCGL